LKGTWKADPDLSVYASLTASEQDAEKKKPTEEKKKRKREGKGKKVNTRSKRWGARAAFPMMREKRGLQCQSINPSPQKNETPN
jgi:hypothetical protein